MHKTLSTFLFLTVTLCSTLVTAKESNEEKNIEIVNVTLKAAKREIKCSDYKTLKESIAKDLAAYKTDRSFFEPNPNNKKSPSFIVFNKKTWTISVCENKRVLTVTFDGRRLEDSEVSIQNAYLIDMNNDGKKEFVVGDLQCAEGPCLGSYHLLQIDGDQIRRINILHTTLHELKKIRKEYIFEFDNLCFTHEFGTAFQWFTVGTFNKNKVLVELPNSEIKKKYPELIKNFDSSIKTIIERTKDLKPDKLSDIYINISKLILRAYKGEPAKKLHEEYDVMIKSLEKTGGLPVHCDPKAIISTITK